METIYDGTCVVSRKLNVAVSVELSLCQADRALSLWYLPHHTDQRILQRTAGSLKVEEK